MVGAGIIGCAVAFELARRGGHVIVYDGRPLAGGATQASAGILAPYTEAHGEGRLFELMVRGLDAYDAFVARVRAVSQIDFEYRRMGTFEVAGDEIRCEELRTRLSERWAAAAGLEWLDADALRASVPSITPAAQGALVCRRHGHVAAESFTASIADAASRSGAQLHLGGAVQRMELSSGGVVAYVGGQANVFDRAVLCAGAWTPALDPIGETRERIRPVRGQLVRLFSTEVTLPTVIWGKDCYIVPWQDGTLLVGATSEDVGFDERATAEGVRQMLVAAEALIPHLGSAIFAGVRVGLRPAAVDGLPVLRPSRDPRVIYAAGHFRNGILLAPLTAQLIADHLLEGTVDPAF